MKKKTKNKVDKKLIFLLVIVLSIFVSVLFDSAIKNKKILKNLQGVEDVLYLSATGVIKTVYVSLSDLGYIIYDLYNLDLFIISYAIQDIYQTLSELGTFPLLLFDFIGKSLYSNLEKISIFMMANDFDKKFENYLSNVSSGYEYASSDLESKYSFFDNTFSRLDFDFIDTIKNYFKKFVLFLINSIESLINIFKKGLEIFSFGIFDYSKSFSNNLNNNIVFINKELNSLRADVSSSVLSAGEKTYFWAKGLSGRNCSNW